MNQKEILTKACAVAENADTLVHQIALAVYADSLPSLTNVLVLQNLLAELDDMLVTVSNVTGISLGRSQYLAPAIEYADRIFGHHHARTAENDVMNICDTSQ